MDILNIQSDRQSLVNVKVGKNVKFFNFVNAYECTIGENSKVGAFVEIQKNAHIGRNCKISSHSFICEGVYLGNNVFIGHGVVFINDVFPRATNLDGSPQSETDWKVVKTFIEDGVSIGSNATILCGITIGKNALVGAGSVVTKDVAANTVVMGVPAVFHKNIDTI